jgi:signal transduction histidine kinase
MKPLLPQAPSPAELAAAYAELQKVERLKTALLARLDHELRTPLAVIGLASELVAAQVPESSRPIMLRLQRSADALRGKVEDLLLLARTCHSELPVRREPVLMADLVRAAIVALGAEAAQRGVVLEAGIAEPPLVVLGDEPLLRTAVEHLVANAVRFTPRGGRVRAEPRREPGGACLLVSDGGPGIPPSERERVFDSFYQVAEHMTREVGGLGLGLAVVRRVAEAHGGSVTVESSSPSGSVFALRLPEA